MDLGLKGKVAVVTGGSTGIGFASAMELAKEGCVVAICGRSEKKLAAAKEEFEKNGLSVDTYVVDVTDEGEIKTFVKAIADKYGRIDIWYNNAGTNVTGHIVDYSTENWDMVFNTNVRSTFIAIREVGNLMKKTGGVIINTSSFAAVIPSAGSAAYAASKMGVDALTRVAAAELAPYGVRVIGIVPGVIETPLTMRGDGNFLSAQRMQDIVMDRFGKPEEVAKAVAFAASDAAAYITGVNFEISGGKFCVQHKVEQKA